MKKSRKLILIRKGPRSSHVTRVRRLYRKWREELLGSPRSSSRVLPQSGELARASAASSPARADVESAEVIRVPESKRSVEVTRCRIEFADGILQLFVGPRFASTFHQPSTNSRTPIAWKRIPCSVAIETKNDTQKLILPTVTFE
jgi:hypothetical protein